MLAFLSQSTPEGAYEAYLDSYKKLPSVRGSWNGRKPTFKQFMARFGDKYQRAQRKLAKSNGSVQTNELAEALLSILGVNDALTNIGEPIGEDSDGDDGTNLTDSDEGGEDDDDDGLGDFDPEDIQAQLAAILRGDKPQAEDNEPAVERTVKPENEDKIPTSGLVFWYLHRAIENGDEFATVPVRRIVASEGRGLFDSGKSYDQIIRALRRKH